MRGAALLLGAGILLNGSVLALPDLCDPPPGPVAEPQTHAAQAACRRRLLKQCRYCEKLTAKTAEEWGVPPEDVVPIWYCRGLTEVCREGNGVAYGACGARRWPRIVPGERH